MTDDEINRRVAEIEGWRQVGNREVGRRWMPLGTPPEFNIAALPILPPPYATDWAWCGPVLEKLIGKGWKLKHQMTDFGYQRMMYKEYMLPDEAIYADTIQQAVCLAAIADCHDKPTTPGIWTGLGDK